MVTIGLSRTVSEINGDFVKIRHFSCPHVFNAPAEGFPLELGIGTRDEKAPVMVLPDGRKSFKISLVV